MNGRDFVVKVPTTSGAIWLGLLVRAQTQNRKIMHENDGELVKPTEVISQSHNRFSSLFFNI